MDAAFLSQLLSLSIQNQASDLHLSPNQCPLMRINGDLVKITAYPILNAADIKNLIYAVLDFKQQKQFESQLELDFSLNDLAQGIFRANIFHQLHGISAVFRVLPMKIPTAAALNLPSSLIKLTELETGLILITGATGCGKSTTLAALIEHINVHQAKHIITLEDPIEFVYQNKQSLIQQRQISRDTVSFSSALRAALREDPDVILVGEMRDLETVRLALTAAETGHMVMATLHTQSAPRAVSRMIDIFSENEKNIVRNLLAESLQAVVCQSLIKNNAGGRAASFEIMLGTPAIRNLIREDKIPQMYAVMETGAAHGMCTMEQSLRHLKTQTIL